MTDDRERGSLRIPISSVYRYSPPLANCFRFCRLTAITICFWFPPFTNVFRFSQRDGTRNGTRSRQRREFERNEPMRFRCPVATSSAEDGTQQRSIVISLPSTTTRWVMDSTIWRFSSGVSSDHRLYRSLASARTSSLEVSWIRRKSSSAWSLGTSSSSCLNRLSSGE